MKSMITKFINKSGDNSSYDIWGYIKNKERNMNLWLDNINTLKM